MKNIILLIFAIIIIGFLGGVLADKFTANDPVDFGRGNVNMAFSDDATNGEVSVATSVTEVVSADSGRTWGYFCNADTASDQLIYLYLGPTSASTSADIDTGIRLNSGECFEINSENLWLGPIWGIASPSATSISYTTF